MDNGDIALKVSLQMWLCNINKHPVCLRLAPLPLWECHLRSTVSCWDRREHTKNFKKLESSVETSGISNEWMCCHCPVEVRTNDSVAGCMQALGAGDRGDTWAWFNNADEHNQQTTKIL